MAVTTIRARRHAGSGTLWREVSRHRMAYLFLLPAVVVLVFVDFIPMVQGAGTSFWAYNIFRPGVRPFVGVRQYADLLGDDVFMRAFWQSWYFTLGSVACQFLVGLIAAVLLNQSVRLRGFFRAVVLIPWVVPSSLAAMQAIPGDLYEAARVDGATALRAFWHITLPAIRPTILISSLLGVIWTFNSIDLIYILTYGGPYFSTFTLAMYAYQQAFGRGLVGYASAVAVVILLLMAVVMTVYLALYRRVVEAL